VNLYLESPFLQSQCFYLDCHRLLGFNVKLKRGLRNFSKQIQGLNPIKLIFHNFFFNPTCIKTYEVKLPLQHLNVNLLKKRWTFQNNFKTLISIISLAT
jgi:hypothetical protein